MDAHDLRVLEARFNFQFRVLDEGVEYLFFFFKPNDYHKADLSWFLAKLEKRIKIWSHRWFSRVGQLVLIKSVLESIPIYWMALSWIPKGILEKAKRICFSFLWSGKQDKKVICHGCGGRE